MLVQTIFTCLSVFLRNLVFCPLWAIYSLMIFDKHANLKYKYGNRKFWCRGYYVDTVGRNQKVIAEYIQNQLQEDRVADQLTLFESVDPFTGEINKRK